MGTSSKTVQTVCKVFYWHNIYFFTEEEGKDESVETRSSAYNNHSYVIQSVRSRTGYMQLQASEMERAAPALYKRQPVVTAIIHFDGTDLSFIDWEWPPIILKYLNGLEYILRPFFKVVHYVKWIRMYIINLPRRKCETVGDC